MNRTICNNTCTDNKWNRQYNSVDIRAYTKLNYNNKKFILRMNIRNIRKWLHKRIMN